MRADDCPPCSEGLGERLKWPLSGSTARCRGAAGPVALELISKAAELGEATAVFLGADAASAAVVAGEYGAAHALVDARAEYDEHLAPAAVDTLAALVRERQPGVLLFANTYDSRDVASRLAARLDCGVVTNVTGIETDGDGLRLTRPGARLRPPSAN